MTASLIIGIIGFLLLSLSQRGAASGAGSNLRLCAALCWLPLCFGPFVVIAHIVFEATPEWLYWVGWLVIALLGVSVWRASSRIAGSATTLTRVSLALGLCALAAGITVYGHESGATQRMTGSYPHLVTWAASFANVLVLLFSAYAVAPRPSVLRVGGLIAILTAAVLLCLASV